MRKLLAVLALLAACAVRAQPVPLIDTHSHLDHAGSLGNLEAALAAALADMDRLGVRLSILLPPPQVAGLRVAYECDSLQFAARKHPGRIVLVGGGGTLNPMIQETSPEAVSEERKQRFRALAEQALACGIKGFGEIAAHHISHGRMGAQHPYEWVPPDHPLLLLLAGIAAEKNLPIDLHLDLVPADMPRPDRPGFNPSNPAVFKENLNAFERLLAHNRKARIIWAHAGTDPLLTRTPELQRELLARHPNLYMSLRPGPGGPHPVFVLDPPGTLKPAWLALLRDFPDRFVLGSDQFHPPYAAARRTPAEGYDNLRRLIDQLPPELARAIAFENAERLYGLAR
jgi:predicted TIM-barrel fold metal-dependent hydrolase